MDVNDKLKNNDLTFQQIYSNVNLSSPLCLILQQGLHTAVCVRVCVCVCMSRKLSSVTLTLDPEVCSLAKTKTMPK